MRLLLRTMILLPLGLVTAILVLLAIGIRVACLELSRSHPGEAL